MVRVCDSLMGGGKTSAAITYINDHADHKFIYISPYLEEAARIKKGCPGLNFVEPSDKIKKFHCRKSEHTEYLIGRGKNIATTHQAFKEYRPAMLEAIRSQGYTLIIDENVDVLQSYAIHPDDLKVVVDAGYIRTDGCVYSIANEEYGGKAFRELFYMLRARELVKIEDEDGSTLFYWALPSELITSFSDVFILTYLFDGQSIHHFLKIYDIPYEHIGVCKNENGTYRFCDMPGQIPDYVHHMKDMIHIIDSPRMNSVGDNYYALSISWFEKNKVGVDQLQLNISNCFKNIWSDAPTANRLWGTFKNAKASLRGKGYTNRFLAFNARALNSYRNCDKLVYAANVFMNVGEKLYYQSHGIDVKEDEYALSIMVQWLWRSALRDGKPVDLYIPSIRMRTILENWINSFSEGGEDA